MTQDMHEYLDILKTAQELCPGFIVRLDITPSDIVKDDYYVNNVVLSITDSNHMYLATYIICPKYYILVNIINDNPPANLFRCLADLRDTLNIDVEVPSYTKNSSTAFLLRPWNIVIWDKPFS